MKWLKFLLIRSPTCENNNLRKDYPEGLMENFTHTSNIILGIHSSTAGGMGACYNQPMESFNLLTRERVLQEVIFDSLKSY